MKEILCISHKHPPTVGGMEKQSFELVAGLEGHYKVHKIIYKAGDGSKLMWFYKLKKRVQQVLQDHPQISLIHLNDGLMAAVCIWLCRYSSIPVVATIHGLDITFPSGIYQKKIIPKLHGLAATISVSEATKQQCIVRQFNRERAFVVANGVDHDLADMPCEPTLLPRLLGKRGVSASGKKIIVTMGRPVKRKGFSWFCRAVLPKLPPDVIFVMVGPMQMKKTSAERLFALLPAKLQTSIELLLGMPSDQEALRTELANPLLEDRVVHLGQLPFSQLMAVVGAADIFVMPNIAVPGDAEGFGLVALEASLRSTPVVAAGIEGITEAITDGCNGLLLESGNAHQWIEKISALLADDEQLATLTCQTATFTKQHYSWDKMVDGYVTIFEEIINA